MCLLLSLNNGESSVSVNLNGRTCIAVIDECSVSGTTIRNDWLSFRTSSPARPFYLLQPTGNTKDSLKIPVEFDSDSLAFYSPVNTKRLKNTWLYA